MQSKQPRSKTPTCAGTTEFLSELLQNNVWTFCISTFNLNRKRAYKTQNKEMHTQPKP